GRRRRSWHPNMHGAQQESTASRTRASPVRTRRSTSTCTGPAGSNAMCGRSAAPSQAERPKSNATSSPSEGWACPEIEEAAVYIDYDVADRIATITLNRPGAANPQSPGLRDELDAGATRASEGSGGSGIILRANGKPFSA